jgi:hypothetical protein
LEICDIAETEEHLEYEDDEEDDEPTTCASWFRRKRATQG